MPCWPRSTVRASSTPRRRPCTPRCSTRALPRLGAHDVPAAGGQRLLPRTAQPARPSGLHEATVAGARAQPGLVLGHHQAQGAGQVDVLASLRHPEFADPHSSSHPLRAPFNHRRLPESPPLDDDAASIAAAGRWPTAAPTSRTRPSTVPGRWGLTPVNTRCAACRAMAWPKPSSTFKCDYVRLMDLSDTRLSLRNCLRRWSTPTRSAYARA